MTRLSTILVVLLSMVSGGCALLGNEAPFPAQITTAGIGPFRMLDDDETRFGGTPLNAQSARLSVDRMHQSGNALFFGAATPLDMPPAREAGLREHAVDWNQFEARSIRRVLDEIDLAYDIATAAEVLSASEAWEGGWVSQPWVVTLDDGSARMFYAADGGIGVADAPSMDGAFTRVGSAPVLAGAYRNPSVIRDPMGEGWMMYVDDGANVRLARSSDGLAFTLEADPIDLGINPEFATDDDPVEESYNAPGAIVVETPAGRPTVRLYAEVHQEGIGTQDLRLMIATASLDGVTFERAQLPALESETRGASNSRPTPRQLPSGETLLYLTRNEDIGTSGDDVIARFPQLAVTPGASSFAEEEEAME